MAVKLRLMRMGKKKQPVYRVVAAEAHSPRDGRFIEIIGTYEPRREPSQINIDSDKAVRWLRNGAQPTERVEKLLKISGAWDEFKGNAPGTSVPEPPSGGRRLSKKARERAAAEAAEREAAESAAAEEPAGGDGSGASEEAAGEAGEES